MKKEYGILAAALLIGVAVFLVDVLLVTRTIPIIFYAVPILMVAYFLPPRLVAGVTAITVILQSVGSAIEQTPLWYRSMDALALVIIGCLGVALARQTLRERALAEQRARLVEETEEYTHVISHDLRAPLAIILGNAQLIERAPDKIELVRRSAGSIATSSRRMNAMIQDLVDSARLESGQLRLNPESLDLGRFVLDLTERMAGVVGMDRCQARVAEDLPRVHVDPGQLERILANLLSNALKYSTPGTPVRLTVTSRSDEAVVSVADQGPGIAPEDRSSLFERYFRAREASERKEGLGLGLYITKGLVEANGGHIWVESEVGKGSTFSFSLPAARNESRACRATSTRHSPRQGRLRSR
jgi:signal transduction histidine kinase